MPGKIKYYSLFIAIMMCCHILPAQQNIPEKLTDTITVSSDASTVEIGEIIISGNKKTKAIIILREIPFKSGEKYSLEVIVRKMAEARRQLLNTALFTSVIVAAKNIQGNTPARLDIASAEQGLQANKIDISVELNERWYLIPLPYFKPVDRNFNQWLVEQKASLYRVNYGVKIYYDNATGMNDKFRLWLITGYTRQLSFSYDRLYIDKKLKWGMKFSFATGKNREVNYNTIDDKQVFFKDENQYLRNYTNASVELTYRKAIKTRHSFGILYSTEQVKDTIIKLNPAYFNAGNKRISFPGIFYTLTYFNVDYIPYPTKGYAAKILISQNGLNKKFSLCQLQVKGLASWPLSAKSFFNLNVFGGVKLPLKQPYFNQRFLGYNDIFMQGFEYYVIDGVAGGYMKTTLTRELINFFIKTPSGKRVKESQKIPVRIFGKIFGNAGYVYTQQPGNNSLSNKMLYSGGVGIDILAFYDFTVKLEWTFNSLGQNGLFLHRRTNF